MHDHLRSNAVRIRRHSLHRQDRGVDIGSNSIRLVVLTGCSGHRSRCSTKRSCAALAARVGEDRPAERGGRRAGARQFRALRPPDRRHGCGGRLEVLATAAVRDAADGAAFVEAIEQRTGLTVRI